MGALAGITPNLVRRVAARLVRAPTDLSAGFPYGGSCVGAIAALVWTETHRPFRFPASYAGGIQAVVDQGAEYALSVLLREWSDVALTASGLPTATGSSSGDLGVVHTVSATVRPGLPTTPAAWLVVPDNATEHPALVVYRGLASRPSPNDRRFSGFAEHGIPLVIDAQLDGSGRLYAEQLLADLSL